VTAPLVVEAAVRVLAGESGPGVASVGARFDPQSFLGALSPEHLCFSGIA
jgi:hypothetical protein